MRDAEHHPMVLLATVIQVLVEKEPAIHQDAKSRTGSIVFLKGAPVVPKRAIDPCKWNRRWARFFSLAAVTNLIR
jgi:hypothetical protein